MLRNFTKDKSISMLGLVVAIIGVIVAVVIPYSIEKKHNQPFFIYSYNDDPYNSTSYFLNKGGKIKNVVCKEMNVYDLMYQDERVIIVQEDVYLHYDQDTEKILLRQMDYLQCFEEILSDVKNFFSYVQLVDVQLQYQGKKEKPKMPNHLNKETYYYIAYVDSDGWNHKDFYNRNGDIISSKDVLRANVNDIIPKDFTPEEFYDIVNKHLTNKFRGYRRYYSRVN